jgi:hypothetical protein
VPVAVVTVTVTVPGACGGESAVMDVGPFTVTLVAAVPPNLTAAVVVNPVPTTVTDVPPATGPVVGETDVTVGAVGSGGVVVV